MKPLGMALGVRISYLERERERERERCSDDNGFSMQCAVRCKEVTGEAGTSV